VGSCGGGLHARENRHADHPPPRRRRPAPGGLLVLALALAKAAPAFTAVDVDGKTRSLAEFKGKVVVLEWVNEGCPYVRKHYSGNMQGLQQAARADGVVWLSIASSAPGKQGYFPTARPPRPG
jgi:cytochrome oxidase Cu insertion factor (SCO1/SenC/PrrC family)